ncbi:MAG: tRNA preQ1(34) S-adenosylmethionine ribosyltransferase-isomerase QueA [Vampirovibrio sp.]
MDAPLIDLFQLDAYDYTLPEALVASHPLPQRDASRMMVLHCDQATWEHQKFTHIVDLLNPEDLLVVNNTKVLPARFLGKRRRADGTLGEGEVEVLLLHPTSQSEHDWHCLMRPARKLKVGTHIEFEQSTATFEVLAQKEAGHGVVRTHLKEEPTLHDLMYRIGQMPIPPYFKRSATEEDKTRYQTVYSKEAGSQAAPTAGLHFTTDILDALTQKGIAQAELTLSVGVGTFRPVMVDDIRQHDMHGEAYTLPQATVEAIQVCKARGGRVIAVGTTTVKTLETAFRQQGGRLQHGESGWSDLYIYPGFEFHVVDGMLTNFHLPKSSLLMMISAFADRDFILEAYAAAIEAQYRFYSYGDCMLLLR